MRVLATTMIVAYHSLLFYTGTWWQFGGVVVPLWVKCSRFLDSIDLSMFVFISGFLYGWLYIFKGKYRDRRAFIVGKTRRLLVPYLFWGVFLILIQSSDHCWEPLLTGISHLWFLLMLFWVFCLSLFLQRKAVVNGSCYQMCLVTVSAYLAWHMFHECSDHHFFLCLESALSYLPVFLVGFFCAVKEIWLLPTKRFKSWRNGLWMPSSTS